MTRKILSTFFLVSLYLFTQAQPPSNVGCMLNESGQLRMYYGSNYKSVQGSTYRYVYTQANPYTYSTGITCPAAGQYFQFGALYTEGGVPIGCHRTADFTGPLGEMRYFSVFSCPLDDDIYYALPFCLILISYRKKYLSGKDYPRENL